MSITLKGHALNQRQLDAITPVMNDLIQGRVDLASFDDACVKALDIAGCPLGYDTSMPGTGSTIEERAARWLRTVKWERLRGPSTITCSVCPWSATTRPIPMTRTT